jgi:hypothetical protein
MDRWIILQLMMLMFELDSPVSSASDGPGPHVPDIPVTPVPSVPDKSHVSCQTKPPLLYQTNLSPCTRQTCPSRTRPPLFCNGQPHFSCTRQPCPVTYRTTLTLLYLSKTTLSLLYHTTSTYIRNSIASPVPYRPVSETALSLK